MTGIRVFTVALAVGMFVAIGHDPRSELVKDVLATVEEHEARHAH